MNRWDEIRSRATVIANNHESLYRSHAILEEVKWMLLRKDSAETIATFIEWAEEQVSA